jgi:2-polyprenyl-3-methyl-5-hydroxy-6-metoxy-1,4-benzoquinol methylase
MDKITKTLKDYYTQTFLQHGTTAKGVDWNDEKELLVRYDKMLGVLQKDFCPELPESPTLLDVGCGWGGLLQHIVTLNLSLEYTGFDIVPCMVDKASELFPDSEFLLQDIFEQSENRTFDFVVCNAILTQKLDVSIPEMELFAKNLIRKMFELCNHGIAFNLMSTRVNFMVDNLYYQNPAELLTWLLTEISPRVKLDHGYSSLQNNKGKFFDFTVYVYKD